MRGLDKDVHPARFTVATSVASGLAVAAITAAVGQALDSRFLTYQVPLWIFLLVALIGLSVAVVTLGLAWSGRRPGLNDQVFFILCAFKEKHWVAGLIQDLHNSLDRRGFDLVLKIPERDYVHLGQVRHLGNLSERPGRYIGGIISPAEPELLRRDLRAFCVSARYPVVFVDIEPFGAAEEYPIGTAFVGYAPEVIGRCAADYVGEHARRSQISAPYVLVIGSNKLHMGRQREFVERLKIRLQDGRFIVDEDGDFDRALAREIVRKNLRSAEQIVPNYILKVIQNSFN